MSLLFLWKRKAHCVICHNFEKCVNSIVHPEKSGGQNRHINRRWKEYTELSGRATRMDMQQTRSTFEQVYLQYIKPVYFVAYGILGNKEDAEDVAHNVFLAYFQMEEPKRIRNLKNYLLKMARNQAFECLKKKGREEPVAEIPVKDTPEDEVGTCVLSNEIEEAVAKLPSDERQIILLHIKGGIGFAEISKVTGMSLSAVYRRYRRAVKSLRESLKGGVYNE